MQCVWIHCLPISNGAYCLMRQFSFVLCCFTKRSALSLADLAERPTSLGRVWDTILAIKAQHSCVWGYEKASSAATTSVSNAKSSSKINLQSFLFPSDLADGTEAAADSVCSAVVADDGGETAPWTQDWGGEEEGEGGRDLEAMLYRLWNVGPGKQVLELTTCTLAKREKCHCFFFQHATRFATRFVTRVTAFWLVNRRALTRSDFPPNETRAQILTRTLTRMRLTSRLTSLILTFLPVFFGNRPTPEDTYSSLPTIPIVQNDR